MNAIILSVGDELTTGQTVDTNSAYLSQQLGRLGIAVLAHATVGDSQDDIAEVIGLAALRADVVVVSGGLGPTADDLTRQALAQAMGVDLASDAQCLAEIEAIFRQRQRPMNPANRIQAMLPAGAAPLPNPIGTAPGLHARIGPAEVFVVPGVPSEMRLMFAQQVAPRLPQGQGAVLCSVLHTFGAGESDVGATIADLMARGRNPAVGTTVAAGMVSVRVVAHGADASAAQAMIETDLAELRRRLGTLVVGQDDQTLPPVLGRLLQTAGQTLATAESCTGGMISEMLTAVPGSSAYYRGGVVSYANEAKVSLLGVAPDLIAAHGAVSESVARAMASGCRSRLGADWALSVTGIAGPGGATPDKPVGLVYVGLAGPAGTQAWRTIVPGTRDVVRLRASLTAMNHLRLKLLAAGQDG